MNAMQEIRQGESQTREFKFRVDSQRKIAKTLVAFANTDGGTIYIGVKDNGVVAGVRGEEELYMIEGAADLHTRPPVPFTAEALDVDGKVVLAIHVPKSISPPHEAHEEEADGPREWTAYFRQGAANFRANGVLMEYWRTVEVAKSLSESDQAVLAVLRDAVASCSVSQIIKKSGLPARTVEEALATLIAWDAVFFEAGEMGLRFALKHGG
jgi:predicted HTH transcriptional regulator